MLISSTDETFAAQFEGYAFVGPDYVHGRSGQQEFQRVTGHSIPSGHDGCYVTAHWQAEEYVVGVDSRGLGRLFLYQRAGVWVLGSSLYELATHARELGLPITPMPEMLSAFTLNGSFSSQMTSVDTVFAEIELVPSRVEVVIVDKRLGLRSIARPEQQDYEAALTDYLELWRTRAATLLRDPRITFSTDLSGGLDSRAVVALLLSTGEFSTGNARHQVVSATSKVDDYRAARGVADTYGFELNGSVARPRLPHSGKRAMHRWRAHCLGTYMPVYLTAAAENPFIVRGHGAGGGNHRVTFVDATIAERLDRYASKRSSQTHRRWARSVEASLYTLSDHHPNAHPMVVHYREFRNRFHFGHAPHYRAMFMPLSSGMLDMITDRDDSRSHRQFYFDIMESLVPGIIDLPFDEPHKSPTASELEAVTTVRLTSQVVAGRVYAEDSDVEARDHIDAHEQWIGEASRAVEHPKVREFLGEDFLVRSIGALEDLRAKGRLPSANAPATLTLSYVHFVAFVLAPEIHASQEA